MSGTDHNITRSTLRMTCISIHRPANSSGSGGSIAASEDDKVACEPGCVPDMLSSALSGPQSQSELQMETGAAVAVICMGMFAVTSLLLGRRIFPSSKMSIG